MELWMVSKRKKGTNCAGSIMQLRHALATWKTQRIRRCACVLRPCAPSTGVFQVPAYAFIEPAQFCFQSGVLSHIPVCFVLPDSLWMIYSSHIQVYTHTMFQLHCQYNIIYDAGVKSPRLWCLRIASCYALPQSYPIFAYRGIIIPLLCSYRGGS